MAKPQWGKTPFEVTFEYFKKKQQAFSRDIYLTFNYLEG
jgi:hypothetical protein